MKNRGVGDENWKALPCNRSYGLLTSQKSSYIILQHYLLLSRNLVYTGLTRAKQLAILVGPTKAIGMSIKRVTDRQRYTALADRLRRASTSSAG